MAGQQQRIDELLRRYLGLVDEYTRLRQELSQLQAGVYQNIARANFSAERGLRYGQDQYDERMRATRVLSVGLEASGVPTFRTGTATTSTDAAADEAEDEKHHEDRREDEKPREDRQEDAPKAATDPLRWFGLFAPAPLREAQRLSVEAVERVVPRLVSLNAEMADLEIEVRRARKMRAKALAADIKGDAVKPASAEGQTRLGTVGTSR